MQIPIGLTELDVHVLAPKTQQLQDKDIKWNTLVGFLHNVHKYSKISSTLHW
jgi:hypothetical protein